MGVTAPPSRAYSVGGLFQWGADGRDYPDQMSTVYEYPNFRCMIRVTLDNEEDEVVRILGTRGTIEITGRGLSVSPQDGKDHSPCYYDSSYPPKMRAEYEKHWEAEHNSAPGTGPARLRPPAFRAPWIRRRPAAPVEFLPVGSDSAAFGGRSRFGNNTAIGCHLANYSYFNKSAAVWDEAARAIKS